MLRSVFLTAGALLLGVVLREVLEELGMTYPAALLALRVNLRSVFSGKPGGLPCFDAYHEGALPTIFNNENLWKHADPVPGLAHLSVASWTHHGTRAAEVWLQTLAPGGSTPIHMHDCEEINIVLQGTGTVQIRLPDGSVSTKSFPVNSTAIAPPGVIYQMSNVGEGHLQLLVVMGCPRPSITIFPSWQTPVAEAERVFPMAWDNKCPPNAPEVLQRHVRQPVDEL